MFGKGKRKQGSDEGDHEYDQPVPYWRGSITNWINRMRDFLYLWFRGTTAIMVIRIRKDRRQDHAVFIPKNRQHNTINWGQETYDIEEEAIIRDNGMTVMYVVEGCRKPVRMSAWREVCQCIASEQNTTLGEEELAQYGNVSVSSRDAYTKMNNRDAEILMRAGQNRYSEYGFYLSADRKSVV